MKNLRMFHLREKFAIFTFPANFCPGKGNPINIKATKKSFYSQEKLKS